MAIRRGAVWSQTFKLTYKTSALPVNIAGWEFKADIQLTPVSVELVSLTTANGGFTIVDAASGRFQMFLDASQTTQLPVGKVVFDVVRTDVNPGPVYLFGGSIRVKELVSK